MNIRYGTIEKTGKKEFLDDLLKQVPKELKLATIALDTKA